MTDNSLCLHFVKHGPTRYISGWNTLDRVYRSPSTASPTFKCAARRRERTFRSACMPVHISAKICTRDEVLALSTRTAERQQRMKDMVSMVWAKTRRGMFGFHKCTNTHVRTCARKGRACLPRQGPQTQADRHSRRKDLTDSTRPCSAIDCRGGETLHTACLETVPERPISQTQTEP
jgi:hypothetical protein